MGAGRDFDHPEGHRDRERQTRVFPTCAGSRIREARWQILRRGAAEAMRARPPLARLQAIPCPALGVGTGRPARPTIVGPDASAAAAAQLSPAG
jgi:hypothetical protein